MSVECVAMFWVVNASSGEKSCLQFSIPTGAGAGGEGGVSHSLKAMCHTFFACLSRAAGSAIEALAFHSRGFPWHIEFLGFWVYRKMPRKFFVELMGGGGGRTLNRTVGHEKISLRNFLSMFKVLRFVRFWFHRKMSQYFFIELIRGVLELSTEILD